MSGSPIARARVEGLGRLRGDVSAEGATGFLVRMMVGPDWMLSVVELGLLSAIVKYMVWLSSFSLKPSSRAVWLTSHFWSGSMLIKPKPLEVSHCRRLLVCSLFSFLGGYIRFGQPFQLRQIQRSLVRS